MAQIDKVLPRTSAVPAWIGQCLPIILGMLVVTYPTLKYIALESWSTEQGSHGPLVLASGVWLLFKLQFESKELHRRAALAWAMTAIVPMTAALLFFRKAAVIELEVYALYGLCVAVLYAFIGWRALKALWFPLLYLGFAVPLPDSLVAAITNPLKLWISETAVDLLYAAGYPIASSGVTIQIGQYQLLVAAACAGLNSLITLSALTLFYVYITHRADWRYLLALAIAAVPIAIFSNLVRVVLLVLLTHYAGEAVAQGFLHYFAGMTTFAVALLSIYALDILMQTVLRRFDRSENRA